MDLVKNVASLYLNGLNQDEHRNILKTSYDSWIEMVPELHNGYIWDLGMYYWDKSFVYVTLLDTNAWAMVLPDKDLANYSNCKNITGRKGTLFDGSTDWDITGLEIRKVTDIYTP